jgi:hypothetical protein
METRIYLVDLNLIHEEDTEAYFPNTTSDEKFMDEAERQGSVYSLHGFQEAFNGDEITSNNTFIRII